LAEDAADVFGGGFGVELTEPVEDGGAGLDDAGVVLGEVSDLDFVAPLHIAGVEDEVFFGEVLLIREQGFEHGGFALGVAAHEADFFATHDAGGEAIDDGEVAVGFAEAFNFEDVFAGGAVLVEAEVGARDVGAGEVGGL
jgi:hypothetical protein